MGFRGRVLRVAAMFAVISWPQEGSATGGTVELSEAGFDQGAWRFLPLAPSAEKPEKLDRYRLIKRAIGLDVPWRYHPGDDPSYADPTFDDRTWELATTVLSAWPEDRRFGEGVGGDVGWFRLNLRVAPELRGRPLGLLIAHTGDVDVFLDGTKLFSAHNPDGGGAVRFYPTPRAVVLSDEHAVLAVRISGEAIARLRANRLVAGFFASVVDLDHFVDHGGDAEARMVGAQSFFLGAAFALALLHLCMFVLMRERRENLFFAIEVFAVATLLFSAFSSAQVTSIDGLFTAIFFFRAGIVSSAIFGVIANYAIFMPAMPRRRVMILGITGAIAIFSAPFLPLETTYVFGLLVVIEQLRVIGAAFFKKLPGSRIIGAGSVIFLATALVQILGGLHVISFFQPMIYMGGFLCFLISISFYLAQRFANVSRLQQVLAELRATQSQLVQSEKMAALGMLVAGVAHEINTPVGAISSVHDSIKRALDKLRGQLSETNPRELKVLDDAAKVIESGSQRVSEIVKRLKSFARLDEAQLKKVDLHDGLNDTLLLINHQLKHGITVVKNYGELPQIACYPSQLNQVFLNLLMNARQAMPETGEIAIRTGLESDGRVFVEIKDTGTGIPPENIAKIFDPGFTTKGVGVGTGLGLSICYRIVQQHRGEMRVASDVGKGTTFTVLIPTNLDTIIGTAKSP
jgi:signal transduction histidine kinase